jgi:hypothetical protein
MCSTWRRGKINVWQNDTINVILYFYNNDDMPSPESIQQPKKLRRAEGGAKIVGVFRVKNHDFTPKNLIFSDCGGRRENCWGISFEKSRFYDKKIIFFTEHINDHLWHRYSLTVQQVMVTTVKRSRWLWD